MSKIKINTVRCKGCGYCVNDCPRKALSLPGPSTSELLRTL